MKLKIGNRVEVINRESHNYAKIGEVDYVGAELYQYKVSFGKGNWETFDDSEIKLVKDSMKFKIGNKVKVIEKVSVHYQESGRIAGFMPITDGDDNVLYSIRFDNYSSSISSSSFGFRERELKLVAELNFKVGNKVKVVNSLIGVIEEVVGAVVLKYKVRFRGGDWSWCGKEDLELIKKDKMSNYKITKDCFNNALNKVDDINDISKERKESIKNVFKAMVGEKVEKEVRKNYYDSTKEDILSITNGIIRIEDSLEENAPWEFGEVDDGYLHLIGEINERYLRTNCQGEILVKDFNGNILNDD